MTKVYGTISLEETIIDNLTGLFSHSYLYEALGKEIEKNVTYNLSPLSLALLNLDFFSLYNAACGYFQGDALLKKVSEIIRKSAEGSDMICRHKDDEFAVIFPHTDASKALLLSDTIRVKIEQGLKGLSLQAGVPVSISGGIAAATQDAVTACELIDKAQKALLQAKLKGKNQCCLYKSAARVPRHRRPIILLVDDIKSNLDYIEHVLSPMNYTFLRASDGMEALSLIHRQKPDLILLDVIMPHLDGFEVCRRLKEDERTRLIPIVLVTTLSSLKDQLKGIETGADDYLIKPFEELELAAKVKSLLRAKYLNDNLESIENMIFSLAKAIEAKDKYTLGHTERVTYYACCLGKECGFDEDQLHVLRIGSALHDIGKIGIPEPILNKPGPLTQEEWEIIKKHPREGFNICLPLKERLGDALDIILRHHEKLNGTGYPEGLKGKSIPLAVRIVTIADIYDALTSDRSYRKRLSKGNALQVLKNEVVKGLLDERLVCDFEKAINQATTNEKG